jgi:hypothetical protein
MTTDELVVDVSQDWVLACDVQRRLMEGLERTHGAVDCRLSAVIATISCHSSITAS